jgi:hypothetical protein
MGPLFELRENEIQLLDFPRKVRVLALYDFVDQRHPTFFLEGVKESGNPRMALKSRRVPDLPSVRLRRWLADGRRSAFDKSLVAAAGHDLGGDAWGETARLGLAVDDRRSEMAFHRRPYGGRELVPLQLLGA